MASAPKSWLKRWSTDTPPSARLLGFPHAGVGISLYAPWRALLPADVELVAVQPPGRESRMRESPVETFADYLQAVLEHYRRLPPLRTIFFGYSLGAIVAFETARQTADSDWAPRHLFVAAALPPDQLEDREPLSELDDASFLEQLKSRYAGIPSQLERYPELLQLMLPALRADVRCLESYHYETGSGEVACPLTALAGRDDRAITSQSLEGWQRHTRGRFCRHLFPGGHFFLRNQEATIAQLVTRAVQDPDEHP